VAFLSVIGLLAITRVSLGTELAPGGLPTAVWWVLAGLAAAVVTKLAVVLIARRNLLRLHTRIATAASSSSSSP
jgi:Kef-type K+ transport system membrane component KefB